MVECPFLAQYVSEAGPVVAVIAALTAAMVVREFALTAAARGWAQGWIHGHGRLHRAPLVAGFSRG